MARFVNAPLGKLRGALGDAMFRKKNGKFLVGIKPDDFTPGEDIDSVNRRLRFSLTAKFSKAVNQNPNLKKIWDVCTPDTMSPFNGVLKENYHRITFDNVTDDALVTPETDAFNVIKDTITATSTQLQVKLQIIGTNNLIDPITEVEIQMAAVIFHKSAVDADLHTAFNFQSFKSPSIALSLIAPLTFTIDLIDSETRTWEWYTTHKPFFAFYTLDADGKVVHHSTTIIE
ncbi:MAG: hypothetical protein NTY74_05750 [Ignavibacteriae bacterium]|nr:hypothetical protein [Ignavibacteriota bacterium]